MIPKIIHYCWFGGKPLPPLALRCINSWKKYLPDYKIMEWNESNFNVNSIPYTKEAYEAKKYAFVSDYARFWILYKYGGLYFDTDVEIIKPMNDIIANGAFMGVETDADLEKKIRIKVAPGLGLCAYPQNIIYAELLTLYEQKHFVLHNGNLDMTTVVEYTTAILCHHGLQNIRGIQTVEMIKIYPQEYFCPISTSDGKLRITSNTYTIHHYAQSWQSPIRKYGRKILLFIGGEKLKIYFKKLFLLS